MTTAAAAARPQTTGQGGRRPRDERALRGTSASASAPAPAESCASRVAGRRQITARRPPPGGTPSGGTPPGGTPPGGIWPSSFGAAIRFSPC